MKRSVRINRKIYLFRKKVKMGFSEVGKIDEVTEGTMKAYTVQDKNILVVNYNGNYYAIGGKCTHMGGDLSKGKLDGKIVTCPRHGSKFDITTGEALSGPKIGFLKLKTANEPSYEVKIEAGVININIR
jgi:3-phenylpropionate/trans-cinnamate dioxygenase ferredoxin component